MNELAFLTERPIAHRALHNASTGVIENSPTAFHAAVAAGYAIECDVQISADGAAVVIHDPVLGRLAGLDRHVVDMTADELANTRLLGTSDTIRTLADHLKIVAGKVPLIVELKKELDGKDRLVAAVVDALSDYDGEVAVMSFEHKHCAQFSEAMPTIPRGLVAEGDASTQGAHARAVADYDMQFVSYHIGDLPLPFTTEIRQQGKPLISWTVRTADDVMKSAQHADQMTFEGFTP